MGRFSSDLSDFLKGSQEVCHRWQRSAPRLAPAPSPTRENPDADVSVAIRTVKGDDEIALVALARLIVDVSAKMKMKN